MLRWKKLTRWSTWRRRLTVAAGLIGGIPILGVILYQVIHGIIGNRSDDWLGKPVALELQQLASAPRWLLIVVIICVIYMFLERFFWGNEARARFARSQNAIELNLTAQTAIAKMVREIDDLEDNVSRTLQKLLEDIIAAFPGETFRAAILVPDKKGRYLEVWEHIGMDGSQLPNGCFCIGPRRDANDQLGVAGEAWKTRVPQFVHIYKEDGVYKGDHKSFIPTRENRHKPPYASFAEVPLIGADIRSIGVLSCDSARLETFDDPIEREMLLSMAATISRVIVVYKALRKVRGRLRGQPASRPNGVVQEETEVPCQEDDSMVISPTSSGKASGKAMPNSPDAQSQAGDIHTSRTEVD
jgi:hypothetical protein